MRISKVEINNFRKLVGVRIDLAQDKTVFVGANNSGKTSAMTALRRFLVDPRGFSVTDFSLAHWAALDAEGAKWEAAYVAKDPLPEPALAGFLPQLDIWLEVEKGQMHYVQKLLPTLDWKSGPIGIRLRLEPDNIVAFQQEYLAARAKALATLAAAKVAAGEGAQAPAVELWPLNLIAFLDRRIRALFKVKAYRLDPLKLADPVDGVANSQPLPEGSEPLESNPLNTIIRIDEISAQRGFGMSSSSRVSQDETVPESRGGRRLSTQLRSYYDNHLDWQDAPEITDLKALDALETARKAFDDRLTESFDPALKELEKLGYPGISDPTLKIATRLRLQDGLNHDSAVQYEVGGSSHRLPEDSNGLGYQNLVSMVFALMSYRDAWMKIGKQKSSAAATDAQPPAPLHLVLVEEPEAYLHAQVQQVFIKHAYDVLRNSSELGKAPEFATQLVVSTHSSHVAHACDFSGLRYFRRLPVNKASPIPKACVVNLSTVFGAGDQNSKFVTRYLKATHCDLFFADGAVFIEGSAERIMVPHFVAEREQFEYLRRCYITWLEVGGSHAHRLKGLVEALGLTSLIITDLDAKDPKSGKGVVPARGQGLEARNPTIRGWSPRIADLDKLLNLMEDDKATLNPSGYSIRVAYQTPVGVMFGGNEGELVANTFEDALFYTNLDFFKGRDGERLAGDFENILATAASIQELAERTRDVIAKCKTKAEFALELLYSDDINRLVVPSYIENGLLWLIDQMKRKEVELGLKGAAA